MPDPIGGWDASAEAWIRGQGELGDWSRQHILDPLLDRLLAKVRDVSVLDVGCGEGRYLRKLAAQGATVTGIDPVTKFIDRARQLHPTGNYLVGMAEALPFADAEFDVVLSYLSIIDIPGYEEASREMGRVLKVGGTLLLATLSNMASTTDGWHKDAAGNKLYRTVDRYMEDFAMKIEWSGIRIINFHRPLSRIVTPFFESGLVIDGFFEPLPEESSPFFQEEFRVPTFQIIRFRKLSPSIS